jgi:hypothetical protein
VSLQKILQPLPPGYGFKKPNRQYDRNIRNQDQTRIENKNQLAPSKDTRDANLMMMIFYLFLQKQEIAYLYIPVWVHLREIEEKHV